MKEGKDCLSEGYPLDLINSLFKHSISICRLPVMPTINIQCGAHYGWLISTRDMVNPMTGKPTSLMRFKQPNDHEFGLLMRIKCHALIKFKELEPIIPRDLPRSEYEYCMYPVNSYPEYNVFETGTSPPDTDEHTPGRILFLTINELNRSTTISSNHWTSDKHTFMNYAYKLKGIDKQISQEKNLSQCVEEMLVGDGLFQIYSPPDQISPPPNTT
ncbi:MAG TPA: hypothetical protein VFV08_13095 [Puia sp.]|nr:hypothetical protein [Puia sp.]